MKKKNLVSLSSSLQIHSGSTSSVEILCVSRSILKMYRSVQQLARSSRHEFSDLKSLSKNRIVSFWLNTFVRKSRSDLIGFKVYRSSQGFSLIEMLIVVTLTVLIIVAASSVLLTTLLSGGQVNTTKTV